MCRNRAFYARLLDKDIRDDSKQNPDGTQSTESAPYTLEEAIDLDFSERHLGTEKDQQEKDKAKRLTRIYSSNTTLGIAKFVAIPILIASVYFGYKYNLAKELKKLLSHLG